MMVFESMIYDDSGVNEQKLSITSWCYMIYEDFGTGDLNKDHFGDWMIYDFPKINDR